MSNIIFEQLTEFSSIDAEAIGDLAGELGPDHKSFIDSDMREMLNSANTNILVARVLESQKIIGMITVIIYRIPYIKKSYIEDFIIDKNYRGQGIGTELFKQALNLAKEKGAAYVDFTSNPKRIEGNKLYEKLGFKKRDTNVYRLNFDYAEI